jgi:hypothetical protein
VYRKPKTLGSCRDRNTGLAAGSTRARGIAGVSARALSCSAVVRGGGWRGSSKPKCRRWCSRFGRRSSAVGSSPTRRCRWARTAGAWNPQAPWRAGEWIAGALSDFGVPYAGLVKQAPARSARPLELLEGLSARPSVTASARRLPAAPLIRDHAAPEQRIRRVPRFIAAMTMDGHYCSLRRRAVTPESNDTAGGDLLLLSHRYVGDPARRPALRGNRDRRRFEAARRDPDSAASRNPRKRGVVATTPRYSCREKSRSATSLGDRPLSGVIGAEAPNPNRGGGVPRAAS